MAKCKLSETHKGEYIKRREDSKTVYIRGEWDASSKRYSLYDVEDVNRVIYLTGKTEVFIGFTY